MKTFAARAGLGALLMIALVPRADAQQVLTLQEAVRRGVAASPAILEAQAQHRTASAARWDGWGRLMPSVNLEAGVVQSGIMQRTVSDPITGGIVSLPDSLIAMRNSYGTSAALTASWTLFDPVALVQVRAAGSEATAADRTLDAARARVAAEVTLAYLDALEAQAMLELRRAERDRAAELLRIAEGRYEVGGVPELDVLQARLAHGDSELAVMEAQTAADAARLALLEHLGAGDPLPAELAQPNLPDPSTLPGEDELRRLVLEGSPELAALRAGRSAAQSQRRAEGMRMMPTVSVWAQWVRSEYGATREAMTFQPRNELGTYGLNFSWSLFGDPGARMAERQRTGAALQTADARLSARRAALEREVEVAAGTLGRSALLQQRAVSNLELAGRQREAAAERYRVGVAPIVERMQAEGLAREAERQAITARFAPLRALAQLQRVSGAPLLPSTF
jgi:cobalt-zinc-cadmium efflux system outer membrane protein